MHAELWRSAHVWANETLYAAGPSGPTYLAVESAALRSSSLCWRRLMAPLRQTRPPGARPQDPGRPQSAWSARRSPGAPKPVVRPLMARSAAASSPKDVAPERVSCVDGHPLTLAAVRVLAPVHSPGWRACPTGPGRVGHDLTAQHGATKTTRGREGQECGAPESAWPASCRSGWPQCCR
jgi:hypothetical protein